MKEVIQKIMTSKLELVRVTKNGEARMGIMKDSISDLSAEIAEMMKEFVDWTIKVEVFYGELTERYLSVTSDELDFKSFDELFNHWFTEIYKKEKK